MSSILQKFHIDYSYPVYFTRDLFSQANPVFLRTVARLEPEKRHRVLFVIDRGVFLAHELLVSNIKRYFLAHGHFLDLAGEPVIVTGGEAVKNDPEQVLELVRELDRRGIDRQSFISVIGGGAVLDMACFAAALSHRGIRTIRIPTTVLSQSDSGVGVKSGVNFCGKKNLVGTFVPPFAVLNDFSFIRTLDRREKVAGISEAIKVALIRDAEFFDYLEENVKQVAALEPEVVRSIIERSARHHLQHIGSCGDPFESGSARPLDFGHWSAHKLESMTQNRIRHGEAVALGITLDCIYSAAAGFLSPDSLERILILLEGVGFQLWDDALLERDREEYLLLQGLQEFQEHLGGALSITLLRRIGESFEVHEMDQALVLDSILAMQERRPAASFLNRF
ncbi:MAG: 3-dehydroquinate synthase [Acidobacteriota bacterium]